MKIKTRQLKSLIKFIIKEGFTTPHYTLDVSLKDLGLNLTDDEKQIIIKAINTTNKDEHIKPTLNNVHIFGRDFVVSMLKKVEKFIESNPRYKEDLQIIRSLINKLSSKKLIQNEKMTTRTELDKGIMKAVNVEESFKNKWKKVPSVTTGGKPNFWIIHDENKLKAYTVVWDRFKKKWSVYNKEDKHVVDFDSDVDAKKYVEKLLNKNSVQSQLVEGIYPKATLQMDSMGGIHAWRGKVSPKQSGKYSYIVNGKESDIYIQNSDDVQCVLNNLTTKESEDLENGWTVVTTNFSDEYFDLMTEIRKNKVKDNKKDIFKKCESTAKYSSYVETLSVPKRNQLKIALQTLKSPNTMVNNNGIMNKEEARKFLKTMGYSECQIKKLENSIQKNPLRELGGQPTNMAFIKGALRQYNGDVKKAIEFLDRMSVLTYKRKAYQLSNDYSRAASFLDKNPNYKLVDEMTVTGAVAGYSTPFAFSKTKEGSPRAIKAAKKYGKIVKSIS